MELELDNDALAYEDHPSTLPPDLYYQVKSVKDESSQIDVYKIFSLTSVIALSVFLFLFYVCKSIYFEYRRHRRCNITDSHLQLANSFTEQSEVTLFHEDSYGTIP